MTLLIVGAGSKKSLATLMSAAVNKERLLFLPPTSHIGEVLKLSDLHLSASQNEVFPLNTLEAMLRNVPVVATDVGGTGEQYIAVETRRFLVTEPTEEKFISTVEFAVNLGKKMLIKYGVAFQQNAEYFERRFSDKTKMMINWLHLHQSEIEICGITD